MEQYNITISRTLAYRIEELEKIVRHYQAENQQLREQLAQVTTTIETKEEN